MLAESLMGSRLLPAAALMAVGLAGAIPPPGLGMGLGLDGMRRINGGCVNGVHGPSVMSEPKRRRALALDKYRKKRQVGGKFVAARGI